MECTKIEINKNYPKYFNAVIDGELVINDIAYFTKNDGGDFISCQKKISNTGDKKKDYKNCVYFISSTLSKKIKDAYLQELSNSKSDKQEAQNNEQDELPF